MTPDRLFRSILFVAPDDRTLKEVIPELDALYELGYQVRTLQGVVSDDRLFDAVRLKKYDVLHFAAHGGPCGAALSDGSLLTFGGIQQVARQCGAKLAFINDCRSASIAQRLVNGGLPCAVGTFDAVEDTAAKQTAMSFYQELARTQDAATAYKFACTGEHYGFFADGNYSALMMEPFETMSERMRYMVALNVANTVGWLLTLGMLLYHLGGN